MTFQIGPELDFNTSVDDIWPAITVIIETLNHALYSFYPGLKSGGVGAFGALPKMLTENSWCPANKLFTYGSVSCYATRLRKDKPGPDHLSCFSGACREADIDVSNCKVRHTREGCSCEPFTASTELWIQMILERTEMPLCTIGGDGIAMVRCYDGEGR